MAKMNSRAWRGWAAQSINPLLQRPTHWVSGSVTWEAVSFGTMGSPAGLLGQGICRWLARSGETFEALATVMPLYVPTTFPYSSWSLELKNAAGGRGFDNPVPETRQQVAHEIADAFNSEGLDFLERVGRLEGFRDLARQHQDSVLSKTDTFWHAEEVGYTEILLGNYDAAQEQLARQSIDEESDSVEWVTESRRRCAHILGLLREDPARARSRLEEWADHSATALRLPRP